MTANTSLVQGPTINVTITLDENKVPHFSYTKEDGSPSTGSVVVRHGQFITYQLVNSADFSFVGAGFSTPFDGIVDAMNVSADGQQLVLLDDNSVSGSTGFQLIFKDTINSLLLLSPDPQVINKDIPDA